MIGLAAVVLIFGTPIIAILTTHQRKMAELLHARYAAPAINPETAALREEIRELKELVHQQAIAIDNLGRPLPSEPRIHERIG
ncbi:hypothetical protein EON82_07390 [bacterium]|nr:MAG: hypothetical protein EON82_07390 [bacterium]